MPLSQRTHRPGGRPQAPEPCPPRARRLPLTMKTTKSKKAKGQPAAAKSKLGVPAGPPPAWAARLRTLRRDHERFLARKNPVDRSWDNGVFERFQHPAITHR